MRPARYCLEAGIAITTPVETAGRGILQGMPEAFKGFCN